MSWYAKDMCHCNKLNSLSQEEKELIRRERRDGGEGEVRGLRKGAERGLEIERKETKGN